MKGQMMLITAVFVSMIMLGTGAAIAGMGDKEYHYISEGYLAEMIKQETEAVDKTFRKNRENYRKMIGFLDQYDSNIDYDDAEQCYNLTMTNQESTISMNCVG